MEFTDLSPHRDLATEYSSKYTSLIHMKYMYKSR